MTSRDLTGPGTTEQRWRSSPRFGDLPRVTPDACRPPGRVVVVAPHPDDEVLGAGGTLAVWAALGVPVTVVAVTDGEGSHPASPTLTPSTLADRRDHERRDALTRLGLADAAIERVRLPDGGVAAHRDGLDARLDTLVRHGDTLLAPVRGDGHPDHDAVADVAVTVATRRRVELRQYAVWLWHWSDPDDGALDGALAVALPTWARRAKERAVAAFVTQVEPLSSDARDAAILPPPVVARFLRPEEVIWRAAGDVAGAIGRNPDGRRGAEDQPET